MAVVVDDGFFVSIHHIPTIGPRLGSQFMQTKGKLLANHGFGCVVSVLA